MIELKETTQVRAFWFVAGGSRDWMAVLLRQEGGCWEALYRFRYYKDDKMHDSEDDKSWYRISTDEAPPEKQDGLSIDMERTLDMVADMTIREFNSQLHEKLIVNGNGLDAAEKLSKTKWSSVESKNLGEIN